MRLPLFVALALLACRPAPAGDRDGAAPAEETPPADAARRETALPTSDGSPPKPSPDAAIAAADSAAPIPDGSTPPAEVVVPRTVVVDGAKLAQIKQRLTADEPQLKAALATLVATADAALTAGSWSVMDKTTTPPSGNKHDYISLARYWW